MCFPLDSTHRLRSKSPCSSRSIPTFGGKTQNPDCFTIVDGHIPVESWSNSPFFYNEVDASDHPINQPKSYVILIFHHPQWRHNLFNRPWLDRNNELRAVLSISRAEDPRTKQQYPVSQLDAIRNKALGPWKNIHRWLEIWPSNIQTWGFGIIYASEIGIEVGQSDKKCRSQRSLDSSRTYPIPKPRHEGFQK